MDKGRRSSRIAKHQKSSLSKPIKKNNPLKDRP